MLPSGRDIKRRLATWWSESVYVDASKEFLIVFLLSNLPFGCLILSHYLNTKGAPFSWEVVSGVISNNWKPGEILILVSALLAPFSFLLTVYHRARRHMPGYSILSVLLLIMYVGSSYIFAYDRMSAIKNEEFIRSSALALYCVAIVIWYIGLVFQRKLNRPPKDDSSKRADNIAAQLQQVDP